MPLSLQTIERIENSDDAGYYLSLQEAINDGSAWSFQGSYGRAMMGAIETGYCMLGELGTHDYYGNSIPGRDEVQEGSVGSRQYVVDRLGEDWAQSLEELS